jgi:hypothetical protein
MRTRAPGARDGDPNVFALTDTKDVDAAGSGLQNRRTWTTIASVGE